MISVLWLFLFSINQLTQQNNTTQLFRQRVVSLRVSCTAPTSHIDLKLDMPTALYCTKMQMPNSNFSFLTLLNERKPRLFLMVLDWANSDYISMPTRC